MGKKLFVKSFKMFVLNEKTGFPIWVKGSVLLLVARIKSLSTKIQNETDPKKQNYLLGIQNRLVGYITGLGIAVDTRDRKLLTKLKSARK